MFCTNCGQELPEKAKFCQNCGEKVSNHAEENFEQQRKVYVGKVRKCPSCGAELPSMVAICPNCGYELNSGYIHPAIVSFSNALIECDQQIAIERNQEDILEKERKRASGWSSWSIEGKFVWIIFNVALYGIPLIIYCLVRNGSGKSGSEKSKILPSEKRKASLIENFQIPNDREAMLSALYFIQTKMNLLPTSASGVENYRYWKRIWQVKAEEIYDKATIMLPEDEAIEDVYQAILDY